MDVKEQRRLALARSVARSLRHWDFYSAYSVKTKDGVRPILVVLPDDSVGTILDRARSYGGAVNLVTEDGKVSCDARVSYVIVQLVPASSPWSVPIRDDVDCRIHPDSEFGMLVEMLRICRGSMRFNIAADYEIELMDNGDDVPVG